MTTALVTAAWLIGVVAAGWGLPGGDITAVILAGSAGAFPWARRRWPLAACAGAACAGLAVLGAARWQAVNGPLPADNVIHYVDAGRVAVHGTARVDGEDRGRTRRIDVRVDEVVIEGVARTASGSILVRVPPGEPVQAGDRLRLYGTLSPPPVLDGFDYPAYLARRGIYATMEYPALRVVERGSLPFPRGHLVAGRRAANRALDRHLPFPESALARGIVTGDRSAMPRALTEEFNRSGTSHLIAISGFNITIVAVLVTGGLAWMVNRRRAALAALMVITTYAVFVGLSASVARATVMGSLAVGSAWLGRPGTPAIALGLAAAAMTAHDPRIINDVGFQLSFSATAGLMLLAPPLTAWGERVVGSLAGGERAAAVVAALWSVLCVTLAASIATLPVMLHAFGSTSLVAFLPNLLLVPLFPLIMLTAGAAALAGALHPVLGSITGAVAWAPLSLTIAVVRFSADLPGAGLALPRLPGWLAVVSYGTAATLMAYVQHSRRRLPRDARAPVIERLQLRPGLFVAVAAVAIGGALAWDSQRAERGKGTVHVTFAESSGMVFALVTGPSGERVLIDTGPSPAALAAGVDSILPGRKKRVHLVVLTRNSPTTTGGLQAAVERYRPSVVLAPPVQESEERDYPTRTVSVRAGEQLALSGGARLEFSAGEEHGRIEVVAVLGGRRIAVTNGAGGDVRLVPALRSAPGHPIVETTGGYPWYDLREHGPVRAWTDGTALYLRPEGRGAPLPPFLPSVRAGAQP